MAINFETLNGSTSTPTEVTPTTSGVVLNLEKNTIVKVDDNNNSAFLKAILKHLLPDGDR